MAGVALVFIISVSFVIRFFEGNSSIEDLNDVPEPGSK